MSSPTTQGRGRSLCVLQSGPGPAVVTWVSNCDGTSRGARQRALKRVSDEHDDELDDPTLEEVDAYIDRMLTPEELDFRQEVIVGIVRLEQYLAAEC